MTGLDLGVGGPDLPSTSLIPDAVRQRGLELDAARAARHKGAGSGTGTLPGGSLRADGPNPRAAAAVDYVAVDRPAPPGTVEVVPRPGPSAADEYIAVPGPAPPGLVQVVSRRLPLASRVVETPSTSLTGVSADLTFDSWRHRMVELDNPAGFVGRPSPNQIEQAGVPNCDKLAVIGAITQVSPQTIEQRLRIEGDRAELTLYDSGLGCDVSHVVDTKAAYYTTPEGITITYASMPVEGAWWPSMAEKGLGAASSRGLDSLDHGAAPVLEHEGPADVIANTMEQLTGHPATIIAAGWATELTQDQLKSALTDATVKGTPLVACVAGTPNTELIRTSFGAVRDHAYWLKHFDPKTNMLRLHNPWNRLHLNMPVELYRQIGAFIVAGNLGENHRGV